MVVPLHDHQNTLTHVEGKCGDLQFCRSKTLTIIEVKCGGGWLRELETLTHDGVWYSSVDPPCVIVFLEPQLEFCSRNLTQHVVAIGHSRFGFTLTLFSIGGCHRSLWSKDTGCLKSQMIR